MKILLKNFCPIVIEVIKTNLNSEEIMRRLSSIVTNSKNELECASPLFHVPEKPYYGEINDLDFKIRRTGIPGEFMVYTKGKIIKEDGHLSIKITSGEWFSLVLFIFIEIGVCWVLINNFRIYSLREFQILLASVFVIPLFCVLIIRSQKQNEKKDIDFIRKTILCEQKLGIPEYYRQEKRAFFRTFLLIVFCIIFVLLIIVPLCIIYMPELK